jgi:hypothetical protein
MPSRWSLGRQRLHCIRFTRPEQIDPAIVRPLLAGTVADTGPIS